MLNAGIAVHHLGGPSLTLATVGGPPLAQIEREFDALGVPRRWVVTESATRVCTTILDRATGTMTELVENGRPLQPDELDAVPPRLCRGGRPGRGGRAHRLAAGRHARRRSTASWSSGRPARRCSISAAKGCWRAGPASPTWSSRTARNWPRPSAAPLDDDAELLDGHAVAQPPRGASGCVVTAGEPARSGSRSAAKAYRLHPLPVETVVNPIGCGDALAAAIAWATRERLEMVDAVRLGIAAAGENLRDLLPARLDRERVQERAALVKVDEVG